MIFPGIKQPIARDSEEGKPGERRLPAKPDYEERLAQVRAFVVRACVRALGCAGDECVVDGEDSFS